MIQDIDSSKAATNIDDTVVKNATVKTQSLLATQVQQRQILAMMGIEVWASRHLDTIQVDFDNFASTQIPVGPSASTLKEPSSGFYQEPITSTPDEGYPLHSADRESNHPLTTALPSNHTLVAKQNQSTDVSIQAIKKTLLQAKKQDNDRVYNAEQVAVNGLQQTEKFNNAPKQVSSFELLGATYRNWVLLIDKSALTDPACVALWDNIRHALSLSVEAFKFPICAGISDKDAADASVAGFVFRLAKVARVNDIKIAALTPLPSGVEYTKLVRVPYLTEMLQDAQNKRQLWECIK